MSDNRIETGSAPEIVVLAHERLAVSGWDQDAVEIVVGEENARLAQEDGSVRVTADERLDLRVPRAASLVITGFEDIAVREVTGGIRVEQAGSGVTLRDVGPVSLKSIGDDLTARTVHGDLTAGQIGRYLNVKDVSGDLNVDYCDAHVNIRAVAGDLSLESGGNATLNLDLQPGQTVSVRAAGGINCRVGEELNTRVSISGNGPVSVRVGEVRESLTDGSFEHVFGEGEGLLELHADGPVSIVGGRAEQGGPDVQFDFDVAEEISGLGAGIEAQISEQLEAMGEALQARMENLSDMFSNMDIAPEKAERIQQRTQEKINKAQEKIRKAQERAARKIADAQRRAERESRRAEKQSGRRSFNINLGDLKRSARSQSEPVSDEERLMILNMVAENKITLEEAEALLSALEGN